MSYIDDKGNYRARWIPAERGGVPHDVPTLGYRVNICDRLRLWRADATEPISPSTSAITTVLSKKVGSEPSQGSVSQRRHR